MTVKDIYQSALCLLSESMAEGENEDYAERAPYLAATFCSELRGTDAAMRKLVGADEAEDFSPVYLPLEDNFPLLDVFAGSAALYLAAMLVIDYDAELYDRLFTRYCDSISTVCSTSTGACESIVNKYFTD